MRYRFAFAALLLPLAGCVVPPPGPYAYPQPGYPGAYPQPAYGYPGYSYDQGSPVWVEGGVTVPLIFYGGGWGYWDNGHVWHRAPEGVGHDLDRRYPGGAGYRPWGGGQFGGRPGGPAPGFAGRPGGGPAPGGGWAGRPPGAPPGSGGIRPAAAGPARAPAAAPARPASGQRSSDHHDEHH